MIGSAASPGLVAARPQGAVRLGRALGGASVAALGVAVVLDLHAAKYGTLLYVGVAFGLAGLGALLTTRMPSHPISWVIAASGAGFSLFALAYAYAVQALVTDPGSLPGGLAAAWVDNWAWLPALVLPLCFLLLLIPDGRLPSRRWRPVPLVVLVGTVLGSLAVSASKTFDLGSEAPIANPWAFETTAAAVAGILGVALVLAGVAASCAAFLTRFRSSAGEERQQLRWVGLSLAVAAICGVLGAFLWGTFAFAQVLPALAFLALPAGITVAVLKYRLYEIELVVNRTLVYGVLTLSVVGAYVAVVGVIGSALSSGAGLLLSLVVTGVVAVSFQPLRERVQRSVNRLMFGERDDPYTAIARLGRTLTSSLQPGDVLQTIVDTIGQTLALQYVAVALLQDGGRARSEVAAAFGTLGGEVIVLSLVHQGEIVGELRLAARPGERLRERDHRLVDDLAPQVAAAVRAVGLSEELQAARQRLVRLREEERRRIRRDLHDGLGPALAGLTFTLEAVRNLTASDMEKADALLLAATEQVQTMIADVRRLIYGLRPPALDQLGLAASLRGLAAQESSQTTSVTVDAPASLPTLPAAVEVAAYWIAQEALTNMKRHAGARTCDLRVVVEATTLRLEIADDGRGLASASTGIGLHTMRERAAEIGGTCQIIPHTGGGTLVTASLPRLLPETAPA